MEPIDDLQEIIEAFRSEAHDLLDGISEALLNYEKTADSNQRQEVINLAFRHAHNIKGAAASLDLGRIENLIHALEDIFGALRDGRIELSPELIDQIFPVVDLLGTIVDVIQPGMNEPSQKDSQAINILNGFLEKAPSSKSAGSTKKPGTPTDKKKARRKIKSEGKQADSESEEELSTSFVRVSQQKLDTLLAQLGELVEMKIRMEEIMSRVQGVEEELRHLERPDLELPHKPLRQLARGMEHDITYLNKLLHEIQDELLELRMVPISSIFPLLRRTVRDVSRKRDLSVDLKLEGGHFEMDRKIVEDIKAPLIHLLRNAVDHGIEPSKERNAKGKPPSGTVELRASYRGGSILIEVRDDGRGVGYHKIYDRAVELGLCKRSTGMPSSHELLRLIFASGMSTSRTADTISGRGIGLTEVKKVMERLRGTISLESEPGGGTTFKLTVPLTLTTDTGLFISVGGTRYVISRTAVQRVVAISDKNVSTTNNVTNLLHDGQHIPLALLEPSLGLRAFSNGGNGQGRLAVILSSAEATSALVVDDVEAEAEVVIRNLGSFLQRLEYVSGMTVSASGEVFFVLNPAELVRAIANPLGSAEGPDTKTALALKSSTELRDTVVLVVDDSATSRIFNHKLLSASGFNVITANDGRQALELLRARRCDVVLTDVQMPQMDGFELTRQIKQDPQLSSIPVILLTALDGRENKERGIQVGADAYLIKRELSQEELVSTLEQLI